MSEYCDFNWVVGLVSGVVCVTIGWLLSFFTELWREKERKKKLLKNLLSELQYNLGLYKLIFKEIENLRKKKYSGRFEKYAELYEKQTLNNTVDCKTIDNFSRGLQNNAYSQVYLEIALADLPSDLRDNIYETYRMISSFKDFKREYGEKSKDLNPLWNLLKLIIKDFEEILK